MGCSALDAADPSLWDGRRGFHLPLGDALSLAFGGQRSPETGSVGSQEPEGVGDG
ncbi:hypothetical protein [uncultured Microbacterium sp.]|uniref:hypothetical protein n=1 Tax=uncultured Microbacterium sp. TaxID=191216 RepID=UPI0028D8D21D|nr:hypothetical protein [uncultured Microbacterium sp.]